MNKKIFFSVLIGLVLMILASVSASAVSSTTISSVDAPLNNSIQFGTVTFNITLNMTSANSADVSNVTIVNYTLNHTETSVLAPFCTNSSITGALNNNEGNRTQCTNNTVNFRDGIYAILVTIANGTTNFSATNTSALTIMTNVSIENYGPLVNITSPGANGTQLVNADFIDRQFEINFSLRDNLAAHGNRTTICELHISKNKVGNFLQNVSTLIANRSGPFTNGSNITFKVASSKILLNGSESVYQVLCRNNNPPNATGHGVYNSSLIQNLTVSDVVLPSNVTSPVFKNKDGVEKTKFEFGDEVNIKDCSGSDNVDEAVQYNITIKLPGLASFTIQNVSLKISGTSSIGTGAIGTYEVNCTVTDSNGNINSSTKTFEVISKVRDTNAYAATKADKPKSKGIVGRGSSESIEVGAEGTGRLVAEGGSLKFKVNNEEHIVIVKEIGKDSVVLTIRSTPFDISLNKGEDKDVDVDGDGVEDINIKFNGVFVNKADIVLTSLESQKKASPKEEKLPESPGAKVAEAIKQATEGKGGIWLVIIVVVIIVVVGYFLVRKK